MTHLDDRRSRDEACNAGDIVDLLIHTEYAHGALAIVWRAEPKRQEDSLAIVLTDLSDALTGEPISSSRIMLQRRDETAPPGVTLVLWAEEKVKPGAKIRLALTGSIRTSQGEDQDFCLQKDFDVPVEGADSAGPRGM
ncbi:hypothetical protein [Sorangium sp. So ce1151]|uniref:hypothetical protein n=1 Tax=Sorangium sp. So ce1151 TaxID=3133332 RepID=UPI003F63403D